MFLDGIFKKIEKTITIFKNTAVYQCFFAESGDFLLSALPHLQSTMEKPAQTQVVTIFRAALPMIHSYYFSEETAEARRLKGKTLETDILLHIARNLNHPCYAMDDGKVCVRGSSPSFASDFSELQHLFEDILHVQLIVRKADAGACYAMLRQHIDAAKDFFVAEHGPWLEDFMRRLGDEVSRISLATYVRQRVMAQAFDNSPICYPAQPPRETADWRKQREALSYDFPTLHGVKDPNLFYLCAYVYEQYAIPGVVEALSGDTVIDAGAYVGDTACYFSKKVGSSGKVFSFEIVPNSAALLQKNLHANQCANVEVCPYALSDKDGELSLAINADAPSTAFVGDQVTEVVKKKTVHAVRLDSFCEERQLAVNFIKADIEGSEMAMLHGAERTLERYAPACALCVYHKKDDFWQIPEYLGKVRPDYTFWFRCESEPVMLAKVIQ